MNITNFKSVLAYQLGKNELNLKDTNNLNDLILTKAYHPLGKGQFSASTFQPLNGINAENPYYLFEVKDGGLNTIALYLSINLAKRNLPNSVIKQELEKRIKALEKRTNQKVSKQDKLNIKNQVMAELTDRAFVNEKVIDLLIDLRSEIIFVGTSSNSVAENCLALLRKILGSLPVTMIEYENEIAPVLDKVFVRGEVDIEGHNLIVSDKFKLIEPLDKGAVTNNFAECSTPALRQLVNNGELTIKQLEFAAERVKYSIACQNSNSSAPSYRNIVVDSRFDEVFGDRSANTSENEEAYYQEVYQLILTEMLSAFESILHNSEVLFGERKRK